VLPTSPFVPDLNTVALFHLEADGTDPGGPSATITEIAPNNPAFL
jgi:hypothetical protein